MLIQLLIAQIKDVDTITYSRKKDVDTITYSTNKGCWYNYL